MKTVARIAQKGGVGKTTLSVNLAVTAQKAGSRQRCLTSIRKRVPLCGLNDAMTSALMWNF